MVFQFISLGIFGDFFIFLNQINSVFFALYSILYIGAKNHRGRFFVFPRENEKLSAEIFYCLYVIFIFDTYFLYENLVV